MQDWESLFIADIYEAAGALRMSGQIIASAEGLTLSQWHVLDAVGDDAGMTVARAARRMGLSRQAVQKVANEMVASGLLEFVENPDHKSSPLIRITARGREHQERLWARATESHAARFGSIPRADLETAQEVLRRITQATYARYRE